jgi:hypothetical protein
MAQACLNFQGLPGAHRLCVLERKFEVFDEAAGLCLWPCEPLRHSVREPQLSQL